MCLNFFSWVDYMAFRNIPSSLYYNILHIENQYLWNMAHWISTSKVLLLLCVLWKLFETIWFLVIYLFIIMNNPGSTSLIIVVDEWCSKFMRFLLCVLMIEMDVKQMWEWMPSKYRLGSWACEGCCFKTWGEWTCYWSIQWAWPSATYIHVSCLLHHNFYHLKHFVFLCFNLLFSGFKSIWN